MAKIQDTQPTLPRALLHQNAMFKNFNGVATELTHLDLSIKISWPEGVDSLHFPNVIALRLRMTTTHHYPRLLPSQNRCTEAEKEALEICTHAPSILLNTPSEQT
ncbi:hypothetical protein L208DRAFT_1399664 [Tricholoma matsutake]|nr:hypothetical protein L208DRAFT_1399664 [Tricholoma matsutake 945]